MEDFRNDVPGAFSHDEFKVAEKLVQYILPENSADQDWHAVQQLMKKPIFGFLNNEVSVSG